MSEQETVFVTGGTGFLGSRIVFFLVSSGYKVIVLKRKISRMDRLSGLLGHKNLSFFDYGDGLKKCFEDNKIDFIMHTICKVNIK